jgi:hypothetical protein
MGGVSSRRVLIVSTSVIHVSGGAAFCDFFAETSIHVPAGISQAMTAFGGEPNYRVLTKSARLVDRDSR